MGLVYVSRLTLPFTNYGFMLAKYPKHLNEYQLPDSEKCMGKKQMAYRICVFVSVVLYPSQKEAATWLLNLAATHALL